MERARKSLAKDAIRRQAADPLPLEADVSGIGAEGPGDQPECGAFSGAVRTDQPRDRALEHIEVDVVDGAHGTKTAGEATHLQKGSVHAADISMREGS